MRALACLLALCLVSTAAFADKPEQERKDIDKIEKDTLAKLYSVAAQRQAGDRGRGGLRGVQQLRDEDPGCREWQRQGRRRRPQDRQAYLHEDGGASGRRWDRRQEVPGGVRVRDPRQARSIRQPGLGVRRPRRRRPPRPADRGRPCRGRLLWLQGSGCISSPTRDWRSRRRSKAPSTGRMRH